MVNFQRRTARPSRGMEKKVTTLFAVFGTLLLLGLSLIITAAGSRILKEQTQSFLRHRTRQTLNIFEQYIVNMQNIAFTAASQPSIRSLISGSSPDYKKHIVDSYHYIRQISDIYQWVDLYLFSVGNGYVMGSEEGNVSYQLDMRDNPRTTWYQNAISSFSNIMIVPDFKPPVTGEQDGIAFVMTVRSDSQWSVSGFIAVSLSKSVLDAVLRDENNQDAGQMVVLDEEGRPVYSTDPAIIASDLFTAHNHSYFTGKEDVFSDDSFPDYYLVSMKSAFGDLRFVSLYEKRYINRNVFRLQIAAFAVVLVGLSVLYFGARNLSTRVVRPVTQLIAFIRQAEEQEFTSKLQVEAKDEIGLLVRSFNTMIDSIRENQILRRHAEFDALQKQIDPHFLFNTFEAVKALAIRGDTRELCQAIDCLGDMFRYNTNRSNQSVVPITEEIRHLSDYFFIQKIRFGERLCFRIDIQPEILEFHIPRFILQPIVENSIRHGMENKEKGFILLIRGRMVNRGVLLELIDNGLGISSARLAAIKVRLTEHGNINDGVEIGVGLRNIAERMRLLYPEPYRLNIDSLQGHYTKVTIYIPKRG